MGRSWRAPEADMLADYRAKRCDWNVFAGEFIGLMKSRQIETYDQNEFADACLLCSEDRPHYCHRRLVAEYLQQKWGNLIIEHL